MQISQLDEYLDVTQYQLRDRAAVVRLANGTIAVTAQYNFYNVSDSPVRPAVRIEMVVTPGQSDALKTILGEVLQATNVAIETETGWTQYVGGGEE